MKIEVAYALYEEQYLFVQEVEPNCTIGDALKDSELLKRFPDLDISKVGIFGKLANPETILREGDRIEVYRPLKADPKDRRRQKVTEERDGKLK